MYRPFRADLIIYWGTLNSADSFAEDKPWANAPKANGWSDVWFNAWTDDVWTDELRAVAPWANAPWSDAPWSDEPWANVSVQACELSGVKRLVVDDISSFC